MIMKIYIPLSNCINLLQLKLFVTLLYTLIFLLFLQLLCRVKLRYLNLYKYISFIKDT